MSVVTVDAGRVSGEDRRGTAVAIAHTVATRYRIGDTRATAAELRGGLT